MGYTPSDMAKSNNLRLVTNHVPIITDSDRTAAYARAKKRIENAKRVQAEARSYIDVLSLLKTQTNVANCLLAGREWVDLETGDMIQDPHKVNLCPDDYQAVPFSEARIRALLASLKSYESLLSRALPVLRPVDNQEEAAPDVGMGLPTAITVTVVPPAPAAQSIPTVSPSPPHLNTHTHTHTHPHTHTPVTIEHQPEESWL